MMLFQSVVFICFCVKIIYLMTELKKWTEPGNVVKLIWLQKDQSLNFSMLWERFLFWLSSVWLKLNTMIILVDAKLSLWMPPYE